MEETIRALSVPVIVSIVYGCINLYKQLTCGEEKYMRLILIIAAIIGVAVGIFAYYAFPAILLSKFLTAKKIRYRRKAYPAGAYLKIRRAINQLEDFQKAVYYLKIKF